jgi:AraC family transcriptional regulator
MISQVESKLPGLQFDVWGRMSSGVAMERAHEQSGLLTLFSSRGTRWGGLPVELLRMHPGSPHGVDPTEHRVAAVLSTTEVAWTARGTRHRAQWRPGTSIFLRERYQLDDLDSTERTDSIVVALEDGKVSELQHDDLCSSRVDFLEHVITTDDQLVGIVNAMAAEARAGSPAGDLFSQAISVALLAHVYDRYDRSRAARRLEGRLSRRQVETVSRYVKGHIECALSIVELAGLLQLSPAYFCTAFSKTLGVTPHRFVLNERIAIARQRLQQTSAPPIAGLACALGFANQPHFSVVFRKLVGCSPSEFRRRVKST